MINNPILKGFHPDPCICKTNNTFYIATSTFEWVPGIRIYQSSDLEKWTFVTSPLTSKIVDLSHVPASGGIWAPDLSYNENEHKFYLVYTVVNQFEKASAMHQGFKDTHNYLITAPSINGPWSKPVYLNSSGFDPSLFVDDDNKKYLVNMNWDYRYNHNNFGGILIQEFSSQENSLIGKPRFITKGSKIGFTEGPHIYKRNDFYYLILAEGGTSYRHAVSVARSKNLFGPYEYHPNNPLLTNYHEEIDYKWDNNNSDINFNELQKVGHASLCKISDDKWIMAFLCSRNIPTLSRCPLGRETAMTEIIWDSNAWPQLANSKEIILKINQNNKVKSWKIEFNENKIDSRFQFLRRDWTNKKTFEKQNCITIFGGESPASINRNVIATRLEEFKWEAETSIIFNPTSFMQMAGLVVCYDEANQYYLALSKDDEGHDIVAVHSFIRKNYSMTNEHQIPKHKEILLKATCNGRWIQFFYSINGINWVQVGDKYDFSLLADDCTQPMGFTGSFIGLTCNDLETKKAKARFKYLSVNYD